MRRFSPASDSTRMLGQVISRYVDYWHCTNEMFGSKDEMRIIIYITEIDILAVEL